MWHPMIGAMCQHLVNFLLYSFFVNGLTTMKGFLTIEFHLTTRTMTNYYGWHNG